MDINELIQDVEDINKEIGDIIYVLIMDDMMIGSTRKCDINEHLAMHRNIVPEIISARSIDRRKAIDSIELVHGLVLNPLELPEQLPKKLDKYEMWLIKNDKSVKLMGAIEYDIYDDLREVTDDIELSLKEDPSLQIEDFAIIIGNSVDLVIQMDAKTELPTVFKEAFKEVM